MFLPILCPSKICLVSKIKKKEHFLLLPPYPKIYLDQEKLERDICTLCALDNPNCFNLNTKERRRDPKLLLNLVLSTAGALAVMAVEGAS